MIAALRRADQAARCAWRALDLSRARAAQSVAPRAWRVSGITRALRGVAFHVSLFVVMARYLSRCIWVFASFLAPSAAASTLASAAAEAALPMPLAPPKAGADMASQVALHAAGRRLTAIEQTVSNVASLKDALANETVDHIRLEPGTYTLSEQLEITRSVKIEADPGTVVLDANASASSKRRVLYIDAATTDTIELIGLNITGGYAVGLLFCP